MYTVFVCLAKKSSKFSPQAQNFSTLTPEMDGSDEMRRLPTWKRLTLHQKVLKIAPESQYEAIFHQHIHNSRVPIASLLCVCMVLLGMDTLTI